MAKSRAEPVKQVESESLSEEGNEDGSTEGSESESETQMGSVEFRKKPEAEPSSSDEEEGDSSETDSGSESDGPDEVAPPTASKQMKSESKKPASKPDGEPATPSKPLSLKRASADAKESAAKKPKQKEPDVENSEKKQLFQRLWSEEDEIAILKGMIEYAAKKKVDPVLDLNAFHEFIKKSIHIDVSRSQLQDKIRRLKKKFENNKSKEKDGKNRTFSKAHEQEAYELSKKIWNGAVKPSGASVVNGAASSKKKSSKKDLVEDKEVKVGDASEAKNENWLAGGGGMIEERILNIGSEAFEGGKGGEAAKEWKNLRIREIELFTAQLEVRKAQAEMVLDLLKSS